MPRFGRERGKPVVREPWCQFTSPKTERQTESDSRTVHFWTDPITRVEVPDLEMVHRDKENFLESHKWCHFTGVTPLAFKGLEPGRVGLAPSWPEALKQWSKLLAKEPVSLKSFPQSSFSALDSGTGLSL